MTNENNNQQPPDAQPSITDTVASLIQMFPTRDEVEAIARDSVPLELANMDSVAGDGGDVLTRGKAAGIDSADGNVNFASPTAFWGKAVMSIKHIVGTITTYLTGSIEFKSSTGIELTPVDTAGSESLTIKNTGVTSVTAAGVKLTGGVTLTAEAGPGINGEVDEQHKTITLKNTGVITIAPATGEKGITFTNDGKGNITVNTDPMARLPTGALLTGLEFKSAGVGLVNLYASGRGTGAWASPDPIQDYPVPGGPVGSGGGTSTSDVNGTATRVCGVEIQASYLVFAMEVDTYVNGIVTDISAQTYVSIPLLSCDT